MELYIGCIVVSTAGRDKGRICAVVGIVDRQYVLIADGRLRKVEAPKKKKLKHLKRLVGADAALCCLPSERLTNRLIRERISLIEAETDSVVHV